MEENNKSLEESQENQEKKTIKQVKQTVQDLKIETETIRKTETVGILEMKNLSK